jgi:hypothetical protein
MKFYGATAYGCSSIRSSSNVTTTSNNVTTTSTSSHVSSSSFRNRAQTTRLASFGPLSKFFFSLSCFIVTNYCI